MAPRQASRSAADLDSDQAMLLYRRRRFSSPNSNPISDNPNSNSRSPGSSSNNGKTTTTTSNDPAGTPSPSIPSGCLFCVADNDPRVLYSGAWFLGGSGAFETTHSTVTPGSYLTFTFNGSGIIVLGTIPQSNSSSQPPTASFTLDAFEPFVTTQPLALHAFPTQPLYATSHILNNTAHKLVINVTSADTPFTIDGFFVFPQNATHNAVSSTHTTSAQSSSETSLSSQNNGAFNAGALLTIKLLAAFLGIMILVLLIIIGLLLFRFRKSSFRKHKPTLSLPTGSMVVSKRRSGGPVDTIFTSTESILRNNNSIMFSDWSGVGSEYLPSPAPPVPPAKKSPMYLNTLKLST